MFESDHPLFEARVVVVAQINEENADPVYDLSLAGIAGSNPSGGTKFRLL